MSEVLRFVFFQFLIRPLVSVVLGLNVRHRQRLPDRGPAIVAANHNSHLDTMVLMTLFPWRVLRWVRPVAAGDYFLRNRLMAWFSQRVIGILPVDRSGATPRSELFAGVEAALDEGKIVILFPEAPVIPIFLHGLGKALPRGEGLLVPFFCDVFVGGPLPPEKDRDRFMDRFGDGMRELAEEGRFPAWE